MSRRVSFIIFLILFSSLFGCKNRIEKKEKSRLQAEWIKNAVLYEVNIRQYTPEGTFKAFEKHLPRLKELGVDILWLMPIHPISKLGRKGKLGSYYSVKNLEKINPEFGTMDDFKSLVQNAHSMGFKVILDWEGHHTGWDNPWVKEHRDWYKSDVDGKLRRPSPEWTDVAELDYSNEEMRKEMIRLMKFWVKEMDIDGYRCDVAWGIPLVFWEEVRSSLDSIKPVFMLAVDEEHLGFLKKAFDADYGWRFHWLMNNAAMGGDGSKMFYDYFESWGNRYPQGSFAMQFITNHDENSSVATVQKRLGVATDLFTVLYFLVPGMPLIYSGQEAGLNKQLRFFDKDTISWDNLARQKFYEQLVQLKKNNIALMNGDYGAPMNLILTDHPNEIFAFSREKENNEVLVVMNISNRHVKGKADFKLNHQYKLWQGNQHLNKGDSLMYNLNPWSYSVYLRN